MWLTLLKQFWPVIPALALAWFLHSADVTRINAKFQQELQAKAAQVQHQCDLDKQLTEDVANEYENQINDLNGQLAAAKRVRPRTCVIPLQSTLAANRFNAGTSSSKLSVAYGVTSDALIEFAADCEKTRLQLNGLQDFVRKTWAGKTNLNPN
jgi:hypothetical protein